MNHDEITMPRTELSKKDANRLMQLAQEAQKTGSMLMSMSREMILLLASVKEKQ